jgi:hypothetical protein
LDLPLLGGIHLFSTFTLQKHGLDLAVEELPGLGITGIQPVVVDQERLMLEPVAPAILADFLVDLLPDRVPEGSSLELGGILLTATATNGIHVDLTV